MKSADQDPHCFHSHNKYIRTSDSLNEGLPIKMTREKFQRKRYFSMKKIVGSTLDLSTKAVFSLDKYQL